MKVEKVNNGSHLSLKLGEFITHNRLFFNSAEWLQNYPVENRAQCVLLNNNEEVIGCFMYYQFKKFGFNFITSAPFCPHIALFYINPSESVVGKNSFRKELLNEVSSFLDHQGAACIDINLPEEIVDTQPFIWKGYTSTTRYSYLLDLSFSKETLWDNLSSEKRKSINKAGKDGLVIQEAQDMQLVYELIIQSLKRSGLAKNTAIIKNILFSFASKSNTIAYIAYDKNVAIGATFCVLDNRKAIYLFGGFDSGKKHHGAGVSCMWQSILKAKELGLSHFDFEGSMNPSIERYFREFGGNLQPYHTIQKIKPFLKLLLALKNSRFAYSATKGADEKP